MKAAIHAVQLDVKWEEIIDIQKKSKILGLLNILISPE